MRLCRNDNGRYNVICNHRTRHRYIAFVRRTPRRGGSSAQQHVQPSDSIDRPCRKAFLSPQPRIWAATKVNAACMEAHSRGYLPCRPSRSLHVGLALSRLRSQPKQCQRNTPHLRLFMPAPEPLAGLLSVFRQSNVHVHRLSQSPSCRKAGELSPELQTPHSLIWDEVRLEYCRFDEPLNVASNSAVSI